MLNENEIWTACLDQFFSFVNIFGNDMIKTPVFFVSPFLKDNKIGNEFRKRISIIKQKLIVILFLSIFSGTPGICVIVSLTIFK